MILYIIAAIIPLVLISIMIYKKWPGEETVIAGLFSIILSILFSLLIGVIVQGIWFNDKHVVYTPKHEAIVSLKYNNTGIHGSFFLGSGTIDTERYYYFMLKHLDGSFSESRVLATSARIYEDIDSTEHPYVMRSRFYDVKSSGLKLFVMRPSGLEEIGNGNKRCKCNINIEIHVPKGTVIQEYQVRL